MKFKSLFSCLVMLLLLMSCKKDKSTPIYPEGSNEQINTWILDSLRKYYYWSDALPKTAALEQAPPAFFNSIRNSADRFSWLYLPSDASTFAISTRALYGYDYTIFEEPASKKVLCVIKSVLKGSPAERSGLKRGDYIRKLNGQEFSKDRIQILEKELISGRSCRLTLAKFQDGVFSEDRELNIIAGLTPYAQPAISQILESGGQHIGYIYLDDFSAGTLNGILPIFSQFKNIGLTDLIIDLRYNSGGEVSEAAGLCAMIPAGITAESPFITYKGNKNGGSRNESIGTAAADVPIIDFKAVLQLNLGLSRVFILTTAGTASAAELVVNNLKPYLQVKVVGAQTLGKDEASFLIEDQRSPKKVAWEMYPIIYKLFNANGQGGYQNGIPPDVAVNELNQLPLLPFGDVNDPLLKAALDQIGFLKPAALAGRGSKTSLLQQENGSGPGNAMVFSDTHQQKAENSIVFTHR
ncbi:S41 family peptidase [Pedobacter gandavensis]|uniref:S41 family peptidase n=1 Tax=Pedobacter TaxID=84567 RepID=UPI001C99DBFC|nr:MULTISPECIES: S41 family peptidase [Pedobacter]WGQ09291.1 S41 family peptidase [Pedobacter gandavensis]